MSPTQDTVYARMKVMVAVLQLGLTKRVNAATADQTTEVDTKWLRATSRRRNSR
jgi:hypothetical protein